MLPGEPSQTTSLSLWKERQSLEFRQEATRADGGRRSREMLSGHGVFSPVEIIEEALQREQIDLTIHRVVTSGLGTISPKLKPFWSNLRKFESLKRFKPFPSKINLPSTQLNNV